MSTIAGYMDYPTSWGYEMILKGARCVFERQPPDSLEDFKELIMFLVPL
jgi:hypothetical protein